MILGQGPWRFRKGQRRVEHERPLSHQSSGGRDSGVAGVSLAVCEVGAGLGQLEAAEELVCLGRKCCIA